MAVCSSLCWELMLSEHWQGFAGAHAVPGGSSRLLKGFTGPGEQICGVYELVTALGMSPGVIQAQHCPCGCQC